MASVGFLAILLTFISFIFIIFSRSVKWNVNGVPWNWPILGMIPTVICHLHRIHDRFTEILEATGSSFLIKGVWFADIDMLGTADPANIHYITSKSFENFSKGPDFKYIFDILGNGIFNSDSDMWKSQRRIAHSLLHHKGFLQLVVKTTRQKLEEGLVPVLESVCKNGLLIDLQDLFQRFAFDSTCMLVTGFDLNSLSIEFPEVPFSKAMDVAEEVIFFRHFFPRILWELQKKLQFGQAKRLKEAWETIDQTIAKLIAIKREQLRQQVPEVELREEEDDDDKGTDLITSFINNKYEDLECDDKFLRDTVLNFMIAGRDTLSSALSWFFFCVSNNPTMQTKIREELEAVIPADEAKKSKIFSIEELSKLVYLHAALCESLRLYPPVPFQHKVPLQPDVLPSGHHVNPKTKVLFSLYALGRMTSVWGEDCMEFKPERWISERGTIKHVPSYKFLAFNAGPRSCLGKEVAFTEMKMVAASMIHNYDIQQTGHDVLPNASVVLHMKNGFKVRITNRWVS